MNVYDSSFFQSMMLMAKAVRKYHKYQVFGLEHIPKQGQRGLIVCNHSFATYDMSLLCSVIYDRLGRVPRSLADHLFFKMPYMGQLVEAIGGKEGTQENAKALLESDELVMVAPGGMREALRPSQERYQILWERRKGFAKLALETQTPVILAFCPKADDLYHVYDTALTRFCYQTFKVPIPLVQGFGASFLPFPVQLSHYVDEPIIPPVLSKNKKTQVNQLDQFHKLILQRAELLMAKALKAQKPPMAEW